MRLSNSAPRRGRTQRALAAAARQCAGVGAVAAATSGLRLLHPNPADVALTFLLAVMLASTIGGLWSGAATGLAATMAFNYFFLPPVGTLTIADPANWFALGAFLVVAGVNSQLVARARARSSAAEARADRTRRLLDLSERVMGRIAESTDLRHTLCDLAGDLGRVLAAERAALLPWEPDGLAAPCAPDDAGLWPAESLEVVRAACRELPRQPVRLVGAGGEALLVLPLARRSAHPAILAAAFSAAAEPALADAVAGLGSLAMERLFLLRRLTDAEALRKSDALKSALLSSVSHELRSPLAAIRVAATALQSPETWSDAEGRMDLLRTVDEEAERLNRVIANLLCMSRIESGALTLERRPCEVEVLVWEAMRQAGPRLDRRRVRPLLPDGLPEIDCDLGLSAIALANLLDNAAKYAPDGTPIDIGGRVAAGNTLVAVWVDDHGPGVPTGEAERIFTRFYQGAGRGVRDGHPAGARAGGTGLGLSIARALVEAHGGWVWVEPRPGGGSRFTCTWPIGASAGCGVAHCPGDAARQRAASTAPA